MRARFARGADECVRPYMAASRAAPLKPKAGLNGPPVAPPPNASLPGLQSFQRDKLSPVSLSHAKGAVHGTFPIVCVYAAKVKPTVANDPPAVSRAHSQKHREKGVLPGA